MFKEIVSQLSFSPAMVERLSTYTHRVRQKQRMSGWSLTVLTILFFAQIVVIALPPPSPITGQEPQNSNDFVSTIVSEEPHPSPSMVARFEGFVDELPPVSDITSVAIYFGLIIINTLTYLSLRQRVKETRIIRRQLNQGAL